jgi:acetyl esterase/lipase
MCACLPADMVGPTRAPDLVETYKTIGDRSLKIHIFTPSDRFEAPFPAILLVHGGGWVNGYPGIYFPMAEALAERGFVVGCVEYRLLEKGDKNTTIRDAVADVQDAMTFLRAEAARLQLDPERLVAAGGSAGGHLAAGTALFEDCRESQRSASFRPDAVLLFNPVIDTSSAGYGKQKIGADWERFSPLHQVRGDLPPMLLFHGQSDRTVPFKGAKAFTEEMQAAGNVCVLIPNKKGGHGYYRKSPVYEATLDEVEAFCQAQGILK